MTALTWTVHVPTSSSHWGPEVSACYSPLTAVNVCILEPWQVPARGLVLLMIQESGDEAVTVVICAFASVVVYPCLNPSARPATPGHVQARLRDAVVVSHSLRSQTFNDCRVIGLWFLPCNWCIISCSNLWVGPARFHGA